MIIRCPIQAILYICLVASIAINRLQAMHILQIFANVSILIFAFPKKSSEIAQKLYTLNTVALKLQLNIKQLET